MDLKIKPNRVLLASLALVLLCAAGQPCYARKLDDVKTLKSDDDKHWILRPAVGLGYNNMMKGYDGYENLGNFGLDFYIQRRSGHKDSWGRNLYLRLSMDYAPLQVPEGNNGLTEDLYGANASLLYMFNKIGRFRPSWIPFIGGGYGAYRDVVELDTRATGKITTKESYHGFVASFGVSLPNMKLGIPFRLIPEIRYHQYKTLEEPASHMTYQLGIMFWPAPY